MLGKLAEIASYKTLATSPAGGQRSGSQAREKIQLSSFVNGVN